jgi:formiminoglutamate deiminase
VAERVVVEVEGERIARVTEGADPPAGAERLAGITVPGLANGHSHAFHRALRGRTHRGGGDFWSWRELMYQVAGALDPDRYLELATATYAEMALAGITAVGEFHYLHHDPAGRPYADPNQMGEALIEAAGRAGVRLTLIDTCYLRSGLDGQPLAGAQVRFGDGDAAGWAERAGAVGARPRLRVAAGVHSVRAVDPAAMAAVAAWAEAREAPLHLHLSEQRAENQACLAATGHTPAALADSAGVLGPRTTAVHATHLSGTDVALLGATGTGVCLCPTTERDLADGIGPARALADAGSPLCLGSDSHAVIDLFEEARAVELDERLASERRGHRRRRHLGRGLRPSGGPRRPPPARRRRRRRPRPGDQRPGAALTRRPSTTWSRPVAVPWDSSKTLGVGPPPATSTWRVARPARRWNGEERTLPLWALATGTAVVTRMANPARA